jgi:hypothetical protein
MIPEVDQEWWYGGHHTTDDGSEAGILLHIPPQASLSVMPTLEMRFVRYLTKREITDVSTVPRYGPSLSLDKSSGIENEGWDVYSDFDAKEELGTVAFSISTSVDMNNIEAEPRMLLNFRDNAISAPSMGNGVFDFLVQDSDEKQMTLTVVEGKRLMLQYGPNQETPELGYVDDYLGEADALRLMSVVRGGEADALRRMNIIRFQPVDPDVVESRFGPSSKCQFGYSFTKGGESDSWERGDSIPTGNCSSHWCNDHRMWAGPVGERARHYLGGATKCTAQDEGVDDNPCTVARLGCWLKTGDYAPCVREGRRSCTEDELKCNERNGSMCKKESDGVKDVFCAAYDDFGMNQNMVDSGCNSSPG